jgi:hypothetical protein
VLPTHEVIALLDDCPCLSGHDLTGERLIPTEQLNKRRSAWLKISRSSIKALDDRKRGPTKFSRSHRAVIRVYDEAGK